MPQTLSLIQTWLEHSGSQTSSSKNKGAGTWLVLLFFMLIYVLCNTFEFQSICIFIRNSLPISVSGVMTGTCWPWSRAWICSTWRLGTSQNLEVTEGLSVPWRPRRASRWRVLYTCRREPGSRWWTSGMEGLLALSRYSPRESRWGDYIYSLWRRISLHQIKACLCSDLSRLCHSEFWNCFNIFGLLKLSYRLMLKNAAPC